MVHRPLWAVVVQASVACQVCVALNVLEEGIAVFVMAGILMIALVLLLSVAVGRSKVQALPNCTVLLVLLVQFMTGAVVSTTVTVWLHWALLVQASVACQVRVASKVLPQWPAVLVTVLRMVIVAVPLLSVAVGRSKVQAVPN